MHVRESERGEGGERGGDKGGEVCGKVPHQTTRPHTHQDTTRQVNSCYFEKHIFLVQISSFILFLLFLYFPIIVKNTIIFSFHN